MKRKFLAVTMTFLTAMMLCTGCGSQETKQEQSIQTQTTNDIKEETGYKESEVSYPEGQVFCMGKETSGKPVAFLFDEKHTTQDNAARKPSDERADPRVLSEHDQSRTEYTRRSGSCQTLF